MQYIVMFSGGVSSFVAACRTIEHYGKAHTMLLFADTRMEDEDLYRFLDDTERLFQLPITRIADGRTPWQIFHDVRFLANVRIDPCSRILKRQLMDEWVRRHYESDCCTRVYGLGWDEIHRAQRLAARLSPYRCMFPLCERPFLTKDQQCDFARKCGVEPPRLYAMGYPHNNCGGFCVKAGQAQFALLWRTMPERYLYHEQQEENIRTKLGDVSILRDRRGGTRKTLTMRRFREEYLGGGAPIDDEEWGGCGCATDME